MIDSLFGDELDFTGRRVLITGAAGGLGGVLAHAFAQVGATPVLADREAGPLAELASGFEGRAESHVFDQAQLGSIADLMMQVGRVDVLVNNAAMLLVRPVLDSEPDEIARLMSTNLVGPMVLARAVASAAITAERQAVIVNISSQLAFCGAEGRAAYATAKAGLAQFTKSASVEWAPQGVRVVGIAPGRLLTTMSSFLGRDEAAYKAGIARVPAGRYGTPEEIARLVVLLASPAAGYMVGETVIVDGGYVLG